MKLIEYLKGVRKEAKKIIFPTKDEVKKNTLVTIAVCAGCAVLLWGVSEIVIKLITMVVG